MMAKLPRIFYVVILLGLVFGLTACELPRNGNENSDLQPVEALPPTLAPLGMENADLATEATAVPTVISAQPTVTVSPLGEGEAAADPNEIIVPTAEPLLVPATPAAADNSQAGQATAPEVASASEAAPVSEEPVVVDATVPQAPAGEPVAANPPYSETMGDYGPTGYGEAAYTVQAGDTLFSIAQRYGTSVDAIMAANGLSSDVLYAGQPLYIPASGDQGYTAPAASEPAIPTGEPSGGNIHVVGGGETLFRIALNYGTTVEALASTNGIPYPYVIYPGQQLIISPGEGYPVPVPNEYPGYAYPPQGEPAGEFYQPSPYPSQQPEPDYYPAPNEGMAPGMVGTHTVAPGETLHSIAQRYGTTAEAVAQANGLMNPNQIYVGQVLFLP
jgi:LysM repeat protein